MDFEFILTWLLDAFWLWSQSPACILICSLRASDLLANELWSHSQMDCGLIWLWTFIRIKTSWILNEWCHGSWILSAWILNELKHEFWGYVPWLGSWCSLTWGWCHSDAIWHECIVWHGFWVHSDINFVCFLTQPLNAPRHGLWVQSAMASQCITAETLTA